MRPGWRTWPWARSRTARRSRSAGVVQRLDAQPVADQHQPRAGRIPDGEREHPVQVLGAAIAPLQVGAQHHFGVAARCGTGARAPRAAAAARGSCRSRRCRQTTARVAPSSSAAIGCVPPSRSMTDSLRWPRAPAGRSTRLRRPGRDCRAWRPSSVRSRPPAEVTPEVDPARYAAHEITFVRSSLTMSGGGGPVPHLGPQPAGRLAYRRPRLGVQQPPGLLAQPLWCRLVPGQHLTGTGREDPPRVSGVVGQLGYEQQRHPAAQRRQHGARAAVRHHQIGARHQRVQRRVLHHPDRAGTGQQSRVQQPALCRRHRQHHLGVRAAQRVRDLPGEEEAGAEPGHGVTPGHQHAPDTRRGYAERPRGHADTVVRHMTHRQPGIVGGHLERVGTRVDGDRSQRVEVRHAVPLGKRREQLGQQLAGPQHRSVPYGTVCRRDPTAAAAAGRPARSARTPPRRHASRGPGPPGRRSSTPRAPRTSAAPGAPCPPWAPADRRRPHRPPTAARIRAPSRPRRRPRRPRRRAARSVRSPASGPAGWRSAPRDPLPGRPRPAAPGRTGARARPRS